MAINNIEILNIDSTTSLEAMALNDAINIEVGSDGEFINGFYSEDEARQLRDWLNKALGEHVCAESLETP